MAPPLAGAGLSHTRDLDLVLGPQLAMQAEYALHAPQLPLTGSNVQNDNGMMRKVNS